MITIDGLITDLASIVTSCRRGELMTVKKIEEEYRAIYNTPIPYSNFGYSSLEKLLEGFPNHFKFSTADGVLILRTNVKSNITELIANEKKSKPKSFSQNNLSNSLFKKHKRREIEVIAQLPIISMKNIKDMLNKINKPIRKEEFLKTFENQCGYELKYIDYGYLDLDDLLNNLKGKILNNTKGYIYPITNNDKTIYDHLKSILTRDTGFSISTMQEYICNISEDKISDLMKTEGFVNFIDVIYDASTKKILSYDLNLIYPYTDRVSPQNPVYPDGVCDIKFLIVNSPKDFYFQIISNPNQPTVEFIDLKMQKLASQMTLLSMFKEHKICAVEYDSIWYRAKIIHLCCQKNYESVTLRFIDHCIEIENGIQISLPTDRLRFLPIELEILPGFIHKGSLAYVKSCGYKWNKEVCNKFSELVKNDFINYQAFVVSVTDSFVCIDVIGLTVHGDRQSIFHLLSSEDNVQVDLH